jgi:AAA family ATP:ADP antiporter
VYRGGDALSSIAFAGLTDGIGFGVAAMAGIGAAIAAVWAASGIYLGRVFSKRNARIDAAAPAAATAFRERGEAAT